MLKLAKRLKSQPAGWPAAWGQTSIFCHFPEKTRPMFDECCENWLHSQRIAPSS
jgi:hypothetical protein